MTLTFHALWLACALGATLLAAATAARRRNLAALAAGLVAAAWAFGPDRLPDAPTAGAAVSIAAAILLFRPRYAPIAAAMGGILAGMLSALIEVQGLPAPGALAVAGALVLVSVWLTRTRPAFAPETLREEGLLMIGVLGLAVASLPTVLDGWQAATNLAATSQRDIGTAMPTWTIALLLTSTCVGALYSQWSRR